MRSTMEVRSGRHVDLVPVALVARHHLYEIACLPAVAAGWRTEGRLVDLDRFAALVDGPLSYALVARSTGYVAGHIGVHALDERAATGVVSMFVDPRLATAPLLAGEALATFLDLAFGAGGLAKLTLEVGPEHAAQVARLAEHHPGVDHEGTRHRHRRVGQELVDVELYAVWPAARRRPPVVPSHPPIDLPALLASLSPLPLDADAIDDQHRLVEDLGLDSLALLELVDAFDALDEPLVLDDVDEQLTVASLRAALG